MLLSPSVSLIIHLVKRVGQEAENGVYLDENPCFNPFNSITRTTVYNS